MGISARSKVLSDHASSELLRAIACRHTNTVAARIDCLAQSIRDWDDLFKLAERHRVLPMLHSRLRDVNFSVPPVTRQRLRAEYERNAFHSLTNAVELTGLLKAFDHEKIPAMPFKGVVLGASVYHDLTTRPAGDLDVLIRESDLARAAAVLLERGFELNTPVRIDGTPTIPNYYEYQFERPTDGMVVELRWRLELIQPKFKRNLGIDWVWPRRRIALLAGAEVPDISPEIKLLVLCMHGSKHFWSRLIWICDVARLLEAEPGLDWQEVNKEAKRVGLSRSLALGVLLAHRVADAALPLAVLEHFESNTTASNLAQHFGENLFDAPGSLPPGSIPYGVQLLGWRDRARFLFSPELLRPNERDRAAMPLRKSFHPFYYVLRPFRILRDRSPR